jgi:hypothetical protein
MKFQSKFRRHGFILRPTRRAFDPIHGLPAIQPGLSVKFSVDRKLDTDVVARERAWTEEEKKTVEDYLLSCKQFGITIWLSPGQDLTEEQRAKMRVKPAKSLRPCIKVEVVDGEVIQCGGEAEPGRSYCKDHDPEESHILRGAVEQK